MSKINIENWKSFRLDTLFDIKKGSRLTKADIKDGGINYVSASSFNNGITNHIANSEHVHEGNALTVTYDGSDIGRSFYQEKRFWATDSVNVFRPLFSLNKYIALFIAPLIKAAGTNYVYKDKWKQDDMKRAEIKLPVDADGQPDWAYIEQYMRQMELKAKRHLKSLLHDADGSMHKVDTCKWESFKLDSLFDIVKGSRLTKQDMKEGNINYIGATAFKNGITNKIGNAEHLHPAGTITVSYNGSVGQAFYQDSKYWATDDVNVLYPKFQGSKNLLMFFLPLIKAAGRNFEFSDKWKLEDMKQAEIKLPVDAQGSPDWAYMERYMQDIEKEAKKRLHTFEAES